MTESSFVTLISPPAATVIVDGTNAKLRIATSTTWGAAFVEALGALEVVVTDDEVDVVPQAPRVRAPTITPRASRLFIYFSFHVFDFVPSMALIRLRGRNSD